MLNLTQSHKLVVVRLIVPCRISLLVSLVHSGLTRPSLALQKYYEILTRKKPKNVQIIFSNIILAIFLTFCCLIAYISTAKLTKPKNSVFV